MMMMLLDAAPSLNQYEEVEGSISSLLGVPGDTADDCILQ